MFKQFRDEEALMYRADSDGQFHSQQRQSQRHHVQEDQRECPVPSKAQYAHNEVLCALFPPEDEPQEDEVQDQRPHNLAQQPSRADAHPKHQRADQIQDQTAQRGYEEGDIESVIVGVLGAGELPDVESCHVALSQQQYSEAEAVLADGEGLDVEGPSRLCHYNGLFDDHSLALGAFRFTARMERTFLMNSIVQRYLSLLTSEALWTIRARSLVMNPRQTVSMTLRSRVLAKKVSSGVLSSLALWSRPRVHAKMLAIELVDVSLPCCH